MLGTAGAMETKDTVRPAGVTVMTKMVKREGKKSKQRYV